MRWDGVLFDLDGTLWNATEALAASWAIALRDEPDIERPPTVREMKGVMGMTAPDLMKTLFPSLSYDRGMELFEKCCQVENIYLRTHGGRLYPGIEKLLKTLFHKVPLMIVSNCNLDYIPSFLEAHGLVPYFKDWECIGRTGLSKGENIRLVAERNGLKSPVYVGDTALDQQAARQAGVPFVHAGYGFGQALDLDLGAVRIEQPLDLLALIDGKEDAL